jgi:hypothetical protein
VEDEENDIMNNPLKLIFDIVYWRKKSPKKGNIFMNNHLQKTTLHINILTLKGTVARDFFPQFFFHELTPYGPLIHTIKYFRIRF